VEGITQSGSSWCAVGSHRDPPSGHGRTGPPRSELIWTLTDDVRRKAGLCPGTSPLLRRHRLDPEAHERQTRDRGRPRTLQRPRICWRHGLPRQHYNRCRFKSDQLPGHRLGPRSADILAKDKAAKSWCRPPTTICFSRRQYSRQCGQFRLLWEVCCPRMVTAGQISTDASAWPHQLCLLCTTSGRTDIWPLVQKSVSTRLLFSQFYYMQQKLGLFLPPTSKLLKPSKCSVRDSCCRSVGNSSSEMTRLQRLPACRRSRKSFAAVVAPSSVTSRDYHKMSRRTRPSTATSTCLLATQRPVEARPGPTPREMDRPGPEGQWDPPGGPVEACDESWSPRSNATALAGYAITTTTIRQSYPVNFWTALGQSIRGRITVLICEITSRLFQCMWS